MVNQFCCAELHDAKIGSIHIENSAVVVSFSHIACFFEKGHDELFDVRTCEARLSITGASGLRLESVFPLGTYVSDGELLVDGVAVEIPEIDGRRGRCHVGLELSDGTRFGSDGTNLHFEITQIGRVIEEWHGPIHSPS